MLVAIGSLIFLTADEGDSPSPPQSTPSRTAGPSTTPSSPGVEPSSPSGTPLPGPASVVVPDLRGLTEAEAVAVLEYSALRLENPSGAEGIVNGQDPPPGTLVQVGTPVALVLTASEAAAATEQSLIGQITALIGALTGLILAVTGMIRILRTGKAPEE
jgi:hypothetical protein